MTKTLHPDLFHLPTTDKTMAAPFTPNHNDPAFVEKLRAALRRTGYLLPKTDREVEAVLAEIRGETQDHEVQLSDPRELFRSGHSAARKSQMTLLDTDPETDETEKDVMRSMALAAREGGQISPEVRRQMDEDRAQAESQSTTEASASSENSSPNQGEADNSSEESSNAGSAPDKGDGGN